MLVDPKKKTYSIVLIGTFNPVMFDPEWFSRNQIISPEEVEFTKSQPETSPLIITPQLTTFKTTQLYIKIEQRRFEVICEKEPFIAIKDFVVKTFEKLGSIVINAYGVNFGAHYLIDSKEIYLKIGDRLAPKKYWSTLLDDEVSGDDRVSGLLNIQMQKIKKDNSGFITVALRPSQIFKSGLFLSCNNHTNTTEEYSNAEYVIENISNTFEESTEYMQKIQLDLLNEVTK